MDKIVTFPLYFLEPKHKKIKEVAAKKKLSMKDFIQEAIDEKLEREG